MGSVLLSLMILQGCKKDETGPTTGTIGINYSLSPPACLISKMEAPALPAQIYFEYDAQKRLIKSYSDPDQRERTEYSYAGNTITETTYSIDNNGKTTTNIVIHTLNNFGFIEKSVEDDRASGGSLYETFYYYNGNGYLLRELQKTTYDTAGSSFYYFGMCYSYSGGDKSAVYFANVDNQGNVTDSTLTVTYTYHMNRTGHIEAWTAWTERTGRGSTHALKEQISSNGNSASFAYTDGPNGYPSKLKQTYNGSTVDVDLTWKCN